MSIKTISDFASLPDFDKLTILELQPAAQLNEQEWTQHGTYTNTWYKSFEDGEVVSVEEDGSAYTEEFSISDCNGTASTFYYDDVNEILYVRTSGSDSPATVVSESPKYSIVAYFWVLFANRPKIAERFDQILDNNIFNYWDSSTDAETWEESVSGSSTVASDTSVYDDRINLYSCKITIDGSGNQAAIRQYPYLKPQRKYKLRILYQTNAGKTGLVMLRDTGSNVWLNSSLSWQTSSVNCYTIPASSDDFTWIEMEFITHPSYTDYRLSIYSTTADAQIWIQQVDLNRYRRPVYCKPLLPTSLPSISQSVGSYLFPESQIAVGEAIINNDGWWWDIGQSDVYLWHNKRMIWKCGSNSWDYEDLPIFFYGVMREPVANISEVRLAGYDDRLLFKSVPDTRFDSTTYPNCEDNWANKPVPVLLGGAGIKPLFQPPECNTSTYVFKVSETSFGGSTYPLYDVDAVYKDDVLQTLTTHYTVDKNAGTFTMTSDPGSSVITCKAFGIGGWSPFTDPNPYRPADILYFVLVHLNGMDKHRINLAALKDLWDNRKLAMHEYITGDTDSLDIINRLQITAIFQLFSRLDGTIEARRYDSTVPDDALRLYTHDFANWSLEDDTDHSYKELVIQYKQDYYNGTYGEFYLSSSPSFDQDKIEWEHGIKDRLVIDTRLETTTQTQDLWENLMSIMEDPIRILNATVTNHGALMLNPTDKIKVTLKANYDGEDVTIYDDETFQIISLDKDLNTGETTFTAFTGWSQFYWTIT